MVVGAEVECAVALLRQRQVRWRMLRRRAEEVLNQASASQQTGSCTLGNAVGQESGRAPRRRCQCGRTSVEHEAVTERLIGRHPLEEAIA